MAKATILAGLLLIGLGVALFGLGVALYPAMRDVQATQTIWLSFWLRPGFSAYSDFPDGMRAFRLASPNPMPFA